MAAPQITEQKKGSKLSINVNIEQSIAEEIINKVYKAQLSCIGVFIMPFICILSHI